MKLISHPLRSPFALALAIALYGISSPAQADIRIEKQDQKLVVKANGELFAEYHFDGVDRPYFYPVIGPKGKAMTRNYPMKKGVSGEAEDHPHHTGLWFTHGDVNGLDFWHDTKITHQRFLNIQSGDGKGSFTELNHWKDKDGKVVIEEQRMLTLREEGGARFIDFDINLKAPNEDAVFGDTKEGSMAIRLPATMRLKGKVGQGHIVTSEGVRDGDTWGKRAKWVDYYGPVEGETVGVAIMDHPKNPRHPTWWHVRDYGLFAANPFGVSYFDDKPRGTGDLVVPKGTTTTFRYRVYFHEGNEKDAKVEARYQSYIRE